MSSGHIGSNLKQSASLPGRAPCTRKREADLQAVNHDLKTSTGIAHDECIALSWMFQVFDEEASHLQKVNEDLEVCMLRV